MSDGASCKGLVDANMEDIGMANLDAAEKKHRAALPTPYGSRNWSVTRAQSDGFGAAKLGSFKGAYSVDKDFWLLRARALANLDQSAAWVRVLLSDRAGSFWPSIQ